MAAAIGIELLTEEQYRKLQQIQEISMQNIQLIKHPLRSGKLHGAIFATGVTIPSFYTNGAESYYAARGFRGSLRV